MGRQHKIFPPLEERRTVVKRRIFRLFINLFVLLGAGVLYYVVFSFFFDTPQEYSMRKSTEAMRREYEALSKRLEEVEAVLDNVEERDRNVFGILFESEPYVLDEYASSRWNRMERLLSMSNSSLGAHLWNTRHFSKRDWTTSPARSTVSAGTHRPSTARQTPYRRYSPSSTTTSPC